jgi:Periplasmic copper-binding protein (NosD)
VAEGRYEEAVVISDKPVRLWGLCPARTRAVAPGSPDVAITIAGENASGSEVRGLAVTGPDFGILVQGTGGLLLEQVWVHQAGYVGVVLLDRSEVTLHGALVEQNEEFGVFVEDSEATVDATVVRATPPNGEGQRGRGINVQRSTEGQRGRLVLTASLVEQNHDAGATRPRFGFTRRQAGGTTGGRAWQWRDDGPLHSWAAAIQKAFGLI